MYLSLCFRAGIYDELWKIFKLTVQTYLVCFLHRASVEFPSCIGPQTVRRRNLKFANNTKKAGRHEHFYIIF